MAEELEMKRKSEQILSINRKDATERGTMLIDNL
jgi:hypothetical protein